MARRALTCPMSLVVSALIACGGSTASQSVSDESDTDNGTAKVLPSIELPDYTLAWSDDFEGEALDESTWAHTTSYSTTCGKNAASSLSATSVANGVLTITTYTEGSTHYSTCLRTKDYQPTYGFIEARILAQPTSGEWSAFWLQSDTYGRFIGDLAAEGAEIDIMELRAVDGKNGNIDIRDRFFTTVHWDGYEADHKNVSVNYVSPDGTDLSGAWHTYGVLWTEAGYTFYLDGVEYGSIEKGVSGHGERLLLSSVVTYDPDAEQPRIWAGPIPEEGYGTLSTSTTKTAVDWVRVWQKP